MKVTKATIKKAIKESGFNVEDFEISGGSKGYAPEIETKLIKDGRAVNKGNKQVEKVVKLLSKQGANYYGYMTGYGAWVYKFESMSWSTKLARDNID